MKQKYSNRVLSIFNILISILGVIYVLILNPDTLDVAWSLWAILGELEECITIQMILYIVMLVANITNIIIRKNKRLVLWSIIPIIYFLKSMLSNFNLEIISNSITELKLWAIIPAIVFIIALIIEIRKDKRKKNIVFYVLAIIMSIVMFFIDTYTSTIWLLIAGIMQFIYSKEITEDSKIKKMITIILLVVLEITFIYNISKVTMMLIKLHTVDREAVELINQIKTGLESEKISNDSLILVKRNNRWGYINQKGKEIIPCKYDAISILHTNKFLVAKRQDTYDIISKNGTILVTNDGVPTPYYKGKYLDMAIENTTNQPNPENAFLVMVQLSLSAYIEAENNGYIRGQANYSDSEKINLLEPTDCEYNDDYNIVYEYDLKNGYKMYIEEIDGKTYEERYNVQIKRNNQVVYIIEDVITTLSITKNYGYIGDDGRYNSYPEGAMITYTNGDIPLCNIDKQINGYYNIKNMTCKGLNGKYRILDIVGNRMIVRDYNEVLNTKDYITNLETGEIIFVAKNISAYEHGYIVKKHNNKIVYMDNYFNEKTKEFDFIELLENEEVMICGDNNNNLREYALYDLNGKKLTNYIYQAIGDEFTNIEDKPYAGKDYVFDTNYYSYYYGDNDY